MTKVQLLIKKLRKNKKRKNKKVLLGSCPQKKGTCLKVFTAAPKKPNSASRKVAKIALTSEAKKTTQCHIPGIRHSLQRYSTVLLRGGRVRDLPGIKYRLVRGKFDLQKVHDRRKARSKYGIPKEKGL